MNPFLILALVPVIVALGFTVPSITEGESYKHRLAGDLGVDADAYDLDELIARHEAERPVCEGGFLRCPHPAMA